MGNILDQALSEAYFTDVEMLIELSWQKHKPEPAPVENVIEARSNLIPLSIQPHRPTAPWSCTSRHRSLTKDDSPDGWPRARYSIYVH